MPDTAPPRRSNYLDPKRLAHLVAEYQRTGTVGNELGAALLAIAGGIWDRYRFTEDRDDFAQEVAVHLLGNPLKKADAQKHVFNYLTTCAIRFGQKLRDKAHGDRRRFLTYAEELMESGREIPERE